MSDNEVMVETTDGQLVTAEFKDGQLQIVEVTPFDKSDEDHILPELHDDGENSQEKFLQVLDGENEGVVHLDLLNLTLVRCHDGEESYQLLANAEAGDVGELPPQDGGAVTCVLQPGEETGEGQEDSSYLMVGGETPFVFLKPTDEPKKPDQPKKPLTPSAILEKAKALQKAKALLGSQGGTSSARRKRKSDLPPPHELLASPNFKLYLYSCKMCNYRCNAVKDMSAHKATEHGAGAGGARRAGGGRGPPGAVSLQCAKCPFRGDTHLQLVKHVQEKHPSATDSSAISMVSFSERVQLDTAEVEAADILVCGACGFESGHRPLFKQHIEDEHGATTC